MMQRYTPYKVTDINILCFQNVLGLIIDSNNWTHFIKRYVRKRTNGNALLLVELFWQLVFGNCHVPKMNFCMMIMMMMMMMMMMVMIKETVLSQLCAKS